MFYISSDYAYSPVDYTNVYAPLAQLSFLHLNPAQNLTVHHTKTRLNVKAFYAQTNKYIIG